jgi:peptide/nickel transport system permease protein
MQNYVIRRLLLTVPTLLLVTLITFAVMNAIPGSAVEARLGEAPQASQRDIQEIRRRLGLDQPLHERYLRWLWGVVQGNLGRSLWSDQPVRAAIVDRLPVSLELAVLAFLIASVAATTLGVVAAAHQNTTVDYVLRLVAILGLSVPSFWIASLVVVLGAKYFQYLPPLQRTPLTEDPLGNFQQFIVPSFILAFAVMASVMRMVRASMLEVLRQDYVRTARAKGLRGRTVLYRHALKNAMLPVSTLMGLLFANLIGGSVVIETIFNMSGIGRLMLDAILQRDYTMVQGITLVFGTALVLINLGVDLTYSLLDPRIRYT